MQTVVISKVFTNFKRNFYSPRITIKARKTFFAMSTSCIIKTMTDPGVNTT